MSEQAKIIFADEAKKIVFEDLQPKLIFADESEKLVFDVLIATVTPSGGIGVMIIESTFIVG